MKAIFFIFYFLLLCVAGSLQSLSQDNTLFIGLWMLIGLLCYIISKNSQTDYTFKDILIIAATSLLARYLVLDHPLNDDVYRYMWEGYIQQFGINPYLLAPDAIELLKYRWDGFLLPNHPNMTAIYPAFALLFMKWVSYFSLDYEIYKYVFGLFDYLSIFLILYLAKSYKIPSGNVYIYALNPVVLFSFAGQAHLDSMMMFFLLLALVLFEKCRFIEMWIALALAFCSKYLCVLLIPLFINKKSSRSILWFFAVIAICFIPYLGAKWHIFDSFYRFSFEMQYNAFAFSLVKTILFGNHFLTHLILGTIGLTLSVWLFISRTNPIYPALSIGAMFLILAPTIHFWYLSLFLPFLCFVEAPALVFWTITSGLWYNIYQSSEVIHRPLISGIQYIPVFLLLAWDFFRTKTYALDKNSDELNDLNTLSIVIPEYNDQENLQNILQQIQALKVQPSEILVAHAGQETGAKEICIKHDAQYLECVKGRGNQLVKAFEVASCDIILVIHCDTTICSEIVEQVILAMKKTENIGGCLGSSFERGLTGQGVITFLNRVRARFLGISFGDQGQFFRRSVYKEDQWDLKMPLMEDVELSLQLLKSKGKVVYLGQGLKSSVRRWQNRSRLKNAFLIIRLVFIYCLKRRFNQKVDTMKLYEEYYLG
ncbi:MAG: glycosyltransferase [Candidatus Cloacimonetes bacterium]|nr:glycosyltransferase [Candidatus Cloacimonadota bacterium]